MITPGESFVVFKLEDGKYALRLETVGRITSAIEITPLPDYIPAILGVINYQSQIIPVFNIRKRFHLVEREQNLSDQLIIARTNKRLVALLVDKVVGVFQIDSQVFADLDKISTSLRYVDGIIQMDDGLVIIHDLNKFLSLEEEKILDDSMEKLERGNDKSQFVE